MKLLTPAYQQSGLEVSLLQRHRAVKQSLYMPLVNGYLAFRCIEGKGPTLCEFIEGVALPICTGGANMLSVGCELNNPGYTAVPGIPGEALGRPVSR